MSYYAQSCSLGEPGSGYLLALSELDTLDMLFIELRTTVQLSLPVT